MKPASAKKKGRDAQKDIRDILLEAFPELEPDDIRSNPMGAPGEDLLLSPAARRTLGGIQIECKNCKTVSLPAWFKQAEEHGPHIPTVIFRVGRGQQWAVSLTIESFLRLLKRKP